MNSIFPRKYYPLSVDDRKKCLKDIFDVSLMTRKQYSRMISTEYFTLYFYPLSKSDEKFMMLNKMMLLLFVLDDHTDTSWGHVARDIVKFEKIWHPLEEGLRAIESGEPLSTSGAMIYIDAQLRVVEKICQSFNEVQRKRLVKLWLEMIEGNREETAMIANQDNRFEDIDDFFNFRLKTIGMKPIIQFLEYAENHYIPEEVWDDCDTQQILRDTSFCILLCNDVHSFSAEASNFDGKLEKIENSVFILSRVDNISIEGAVRKLTKLYAQKEAEVHAMGRLLTEKFDAKYKDIEWFVDRIEHQIGGHYRATTLMDRYKSEKDKQETTDIDYSDRPEPIYDFD